MRTLLEQIVICVLACAAMSEAVLPLVAWHGLGQSCCNKTDKMRKYMGMFRELTNGTYMHSLMLGFDEDDDRLNSYILNVDFQVELACTMIRADTRLWGGYNAVGASQGSQFLRALAQRCPWPPMRTLLTLGGQHQGVFGIPECERQFDALRCDLIRRSISELVYTEEVQAEYWHDPIQHELYKQKNKFIADINQEKEYHPEYKANLLKLKKFVMVRFLQDTTVVPNISSWFGFYKEGQDVEEETLQESRIYKEDLLGLKELDERGALVFEQYDGSHCRFSDQYWVYLVKTYLMDD